MITDEEMVKLIERTHDVVRKGFARHVQFPEHVAIDSPVYATVLASLLEDAKEGKDLGSRFPRE